jgi:nicotinamidase-related amidase
MPLLRVPYKMLSAPVPPFRLTRSNAALLLLDFQHYTATRSRGLGQEASQRGIDRELDEYYSQVDAALRNTAELLAACRTHGLPVFHTFLCSTAPDHSDLSRQLRASELPVPSGDPRDEYLPAIAPRAGETVVTHGAYSPFTSTPLLEQLRSAKVDTIILAGLMANYAGQMTAREAADRDLGVVFAWDCSASETLEWHLQLRTALVGGLIRVRVLHEILDMLEGTRT